jgi:Ser/Thr protein kinase RdoA (MazF antagonist)
LGTATCYGAITEHQAGRYGLFLEKVPGLELYQVGDIATWRQVARWLAVMHARFAGEAELLTQAAHLLRYDEGFYWVWIRRARASLGQAESSQPRDGRHPMERLARHYGEVIEHLMALPETFIHGEFYASNVLVQERAGEPPRVCPIDWEMAAVGPGLMDLAALIAGGWTEEEKAALAMAYYDVLVLDSDCPPAPDVFLTALEYCRIHLAVQWLGWFGRWRPFRAHAQDWLGEALRLAERLGL